MRVHFSRSAEESDSHHPCSHTVNTGAIRPIKGLLLKLGSHQIPDLANQITSPHLIWIIPNLPPAPSVVSEADEKSFVCLFVCLFVFWSNSHPKPSDFSLLSFWSPLFTIVEWACLPQYPLICPQQSPCGACPRNTRHRYTDTSSCIAMGESIQMTYLHGMNQQLLHS